MEPGWQDGGWTMQPRPMASGLINLCVCVYVEEKVLVARVLEHTYAV